MWIGIRPGAKSSTGFPHGRILALMKPAVLMPEQPASGAPVLAWPGAALLVAVSTLAGLAVASRWGDDPVVLLYIPPVLAAAAWWGLWPALLAAVSGTLAYNYFFTQPYRTFAINSPVDVVTVVILFLVAIVTSQLAGKLREQARLAAAHAARNATIAGFARRLLSCTSEAGIAETATADLADLFGCNAVMLTGGMETRMLASDPVGAMLAPSDLAAAALTMTTGEIAGRGVGRLEPVDWQFRPISADRGPIAAMGLAREDGQPPVADHQQALLGNLLDQVALALERARLESDARDVSAMRERDKIRAALLVSIGEDVKPRLNAIAAAARALRRTASDDKAALSGIAQEVARLDRYVDSLVEIEPGTVQEPLQLGDLTIDLYQRMVWRKGEAVSLTPKEFAVLAELARHAGRVLTHAHLLRTVWGPAQENQIDYLRVAIRSLRLKLEQDPAQPTLIVNQPAVGYRLVADEEFSYSETIR